MKQRARRRPRTASDRAAVPAPTTYLHRWPSSDDAMFSVAVHDDGQFRFEGLNRAAERLTGFASPEVVGRTPEELQPPGHAAVVTARYRECVRAGVPISYLETLEFPNGRSDWRTTLEPVRDESGRIVRISGRARQIHAIDATQEELTEAEFRRALGLFPTGIALLDAQGVILFVNRTWEKFGVHYGDTESSVGEMYPDVCRRLDSAGLPDGDEVEPKLRRLVSGETEHFGHSYTWRDGHYVLRATRLVLNGRLRIVMVHQDVSDVVSARALAERLAEDLQRAQEDERSRIARDLHDSTSQHLVAVALSVAALQRHGVTPSAIQEILHSVSEAQREIRSLTYLLYPPKLSSDGLEETLRRFIDGYRRRSGLSMTLETQGPLNNLPEDVQLAVLRVVQEALGNVHGHAQARTVAIEVRLEKLGLRLAVVDDGHGAAQRAELAPTGVGIRGMQARFAQFGGELTVTHGPEGTAVEGFLPWQGP